jgi:TonB family protein
VPPVAVAPTTAAQTQPTNPAPQYPEMLRAAEIEGQVTAQWTTDAQGAPIVSDIRIISSSHDLFTRAVLNVLPRWRSAPHTQYEIPFVFVLSNKTGAHPFDAPPNANIVAANPLSETEVAARREAARAVHGKPTPVSDNQTFFEFQVENQVKQQPGNHAPRYPDELRELKVEGTVLAQFVVGVDGVPIPDTFKVLKSTDERFTDAVRTALPDMLFYPALVGGKPVKQLVQMPFEFNLSKEP